MESVTNILNKFMILAILYLLTTMSVQASYKPPVLKSGIWKAIIQRPDGQQIVFNFETKDSAGKTVLYVMNGSERLVVDSIEVQGDSVYIQMPFFESSFSARITDKDQLDGTWIKGLGNTVQQLPFKAEYNQAQRFEVKKPAAFNITGRWASSFTNKNKKVSQIVGEFKQVGSYLTGTFLDPTGDYRFLEGIVSGDSLKLSAFDGGHAYLFTAKIDNEQRISGGKFYSGASGLQDWKAQKNENASIPDGYNSSVIKPGKLNFSFPGIEDGSNISLSDEKYRNKVVVLQLLGSWCPNCMDETKFLSEYYEKKKQRGFEIIGIAYERTTDFEKSRKALQSFKNRFNIQYPVVVPAVAVSDTLRAEKTLPQLGKIEAFPTTVFIDKKGNIRKVHSGFNGPATGKHYEEFKKEFDDVIEKLLAEE